MDFVGNFTNMSLPSFEPIIIDTADVIKNVCSQIDDKIVLCCFLILSFWVVNRVMVPRIYNTFKPYVNTFFPNSLQTFDKIVEYFISFLETGALFGGAVIVGLAFIQYGFTGLYKVWTIILVGIVLLTIIAEIVGYFVRKRAKKDSEGA